MSGPFRVPYENVFVDNGGITKKVVVQGSVYLVQEIKDMDGNRFLMTCGDSPHHRPLTQEMRGFVLERFALSLIAPKEA